MGWVQRKWSGIDTSGFGYMKDEWPHRAKHDYAEYTLIPPILDMPRDQREAMERDNLEPYGSLITEGGRGRPIWSAQEFQICKEWVLQHETVTDVGHLFWVNFRSIPPSWILIDREEAYKLVTEEEYGHPRPQEAWDALEREKREHIANGR